MNDPAAPGRPVELTERESYGKLVRRVRQLMNVKTNTGSTILVVSDGDDALVSFVLREGWHFPQVDGGTYAGFLPTDDADAIAQLEMLRARGAEFFILPATAFWWLEHYVGFRDHLETKYERRWADDDCVMFDLDPPPGAKDRRRKTEAPKLTRDPGAPEPPTSGIVDIDVERTRLHQRFFDRFPVDSLDEFRSSIPGTPSLDSFHEIEDADNPGYSGWAYWFFFLRGYLEYVDTGRLGKGNSYYEYLHRHMIPAKRADRGLADELANPLTSIERIAKRFRDVDFYDHPGKRAIGGYGPAPVKLIRSEYAPSHGARRIFVWGAEAPLLVRRIDGHHRLFAARLFGSVEHRGQIVAEPRELPHLRGAVEEFQFVGNRLQIRGWCVDPRLQIESFEVRQGGAAIAETWVEGRLDIGERFSSIPHSARSGFAVDIEYVHPAGSPARFDVVPRSDWLPIGVLSAVYVPGMFDRGVPPDDAMRAATILDATVRALGLHRAHDAVRSVLLYDSEVPLRPFLRDFFPAAKDSEAEVDLILAVSVLPELTARAQAGWLRRAHALLAPGGHLVVSTLGELVRPFVAGSPLGEELEAKGIARAKRTYQTRQHAEALCARWFEVVDYVVGGVENEQDMIVLRRK